MSQPIITVSGVSKKYRLGQIGMTSLRDDMQRFAGWARSLAGGAAHVEKADKRDFWALREVSFEVRPGEVVGIIGRNGAGKSTLLKILSRITEPTTGEIRMRGRVGSLLEVGTGFHPELSGRDNIFLNGAILGMTKAEITEKFDEIVAFSEIGKFIDTPVKRYSSGMYVRLAFAIAAHLEPEILIVDEVLAVGDADFQKKCLGRMEKISKNDNKTILFVSHSIAAIRRLCDRCVYLERDKPALLLSVEEAIERYSAQRVASPCHIPLLERERKGRHGREVRLLNITLGGTQQLTYGEAASFIFEFEVNQEQNELMLGIGFDSMEGQRLLSLDSDTCSTAWKLAPGRYSVELGLDFFPLQPGNYTVSTALFSGHNCMDAADGCAVWEVMSGKADNLSDRGNGGVRLKPSVSLTALESARSP